MKERMFNYIVKNSKDILIQMGNLSIKRGDSYNKNEINLVSKIGVIIGITGKISGQIVFNFPEDTGKKIASYILGDMPIVTLDDLSKSAICQVVNLIMGNTLTNLIDDEIVLDMTPCGVVEGDKIIYSLPDYAITTIPLISKDTIIEIDIIIDKSKE